MLSSPAELLPQHPFDPRPGDLVDQVADQPVPFQSSSSVPNPLLPRSPTDHACLGEIASTPARRSLDELGFGLGTVDQRLPFQRTTSVRC